MNMGNEFQKEVSGVEKKLQNTKSELEMGSIEAKIADSSKTK